jgi:hypothetical protein
MVIKSKQSKFNIEHGYKVNKVSLTLNMVIKSKQSKFNIEHGYRE